MFKSRQWWIPIEQKYYFKLAIWGVLSANNEPLYPVPKGGLITGWVTVSRSLARHQPHYCAGNDKYDVAIALFRDILFSKKSESDWKTIRK
ncbi:hypothetical protein RHO15_03370 [Utexia brackfieldae]|uniref:hypothetical protein n=1 Tax=Utexia brackfieldae TaxID=3074108 RepID=UPI00370DA323